jgi:hypothetical protein
VVCAARYYINRPPAEQLVVCAVIVWWCWVGLLLVSQPLASVALRATAVAAGPSKLIQPLLQVRQIGLFLYVCGLLQVSQGRLADNSCVWRTLCVATASATTAVASGWVL